MYTFLLSLPQTQGFDVEDGIGLVKTNAFGQLLFLKASRKTKAKVILFQIVATGKREGGAGA